MHPTNISRAEKFFFLSQEKMGGGKSMEFPLISTGSAENTRNGTCVLTSERRAPRNRMRGFLMSEAVRACAVFSCCFFLAIALDKQYNLRTNNNHEPDNMAVFPLLPREIPFLARAVFRA